MEGEIVMQQRNLSQQLIADSQLENLSEEEYLSIIKDLQRELQWEKDLRDAKVLAVKRSPQYLLGNAFLKALKPSIHTILFPYRCGKILGGLLCEKINNKLRRTLKKYKKIKKQIESNRFFKFLFAERLTEVNHIFDIQQLEVIYGKAKKRNKLMVGKRLYNRYKQTGRLTDCYRILDELIASYGNNEFFHREIQLTLDKLELLHSKLYAAEGDCSVFSELPKGKKVLNVLNTSMPYLQNGYSIRSRYVIDNQKKLGLEPIVVTRPGFPNDFVEGALKKKGQIIKEEVEGVTYYRTYPDVIMRFTPFSQYIEKYVDAICRVIELEKPDFVQSASNYVNGIAGLHAARKKGLPFVYEIRGFWELTTITKEPLYKNSENFQLEQKLEQYLIFNADRLVVISQGLKNELIEKGISEDKITVVPNGVDTSNIKPMERDGSLYEKYSLDNKFVIGYIGSIVRYEGLQELIKALSDLVISGNQDFKLLIAGDGGYLQKLKNLTADLRLEEYVIFLGKIPHSDVPKYYSLFDICVFPRLDEEVTNIVTPLKPLEAMASGKVVIGSNLEAMREMVVDNVNGFIFDNTHEDLKNKIMYLYNNRTICDKMKIRARSWVIENRDWSVVTQGYLKIYT